MLGNKVVGVTPLDIKQPKGTGQAVVTVRKAKFIDDIVKIDLAADSQREVALKKVPEPPKKPPEPPKKPPTPPIEVTKKPPVEPPKPKCVQPQYYNPYDTSCGGKPCPPCS